MTAAIIPIGRARHRCAVCGGRSVENNRLGMSTDANGKDVFLHLDCMPTWAAWRQSTCRLCGEGDYTDDPIGIFLDGKGGDVALHQACWSAWATPAAPACATPTACSAAVALTVGDTWKVFAGSEDAEFHIRGIDRMTELTKRQQRPDHLWRPGQSGNLAGRPKGSRNRLSEDFIAALYDDFQNHGSAAIAACRAEKPEVYLRVIASLLPKDVNSDHAQPRRSHGRSADAQAGDADRDGLIAALPWWPRGSRATIGEFAAVLALISATWTPIPSATASVWPQCSRVSPILVASV